MTNFGLDLPKLREIKQDGSADGNLGIRRNFDLCAALREIIPSRTSRT